MRKKISIALVICLILPLVFVFSACGNIKKVSGKTFIYSKCKVTGNVQKSDVDETWGGAYIVFGDDTYSIYTSDNFLMETYSYAIKNSTIYEVEENNKIKEDGLKIKISGSQLVIELNDIDGSFKMFFKEK